MNILYIDHYAGSPEMGMEFRPYYLSQEWEKMGHKVSIIAGDYSHLRKINPIVTHDMQKDTIDGIDYYWLSTGTYDGNGIKRALSMFRFCRKLSKWKKWISSTLKPDVVISSSTYPIDSIPAHKIARENGQKTKHVHEVHDMWPSTLIEIGGMSKSNPFVLLMQFGENYAYKNADAVVSLAKYANVYMVEHGLDPSKFYYVPNGIVKEEWDNPKPLPEEHRTILEDIKREGKFVVGYFGGHALSNCLSTLIQCAGEMQDDNVCFVLVGDGVEKNSLIEKAKDINNVLFLPPISKKAIPSLNEYFDCTYIGSKDSSLYRFGVCMNKMFDGMMAGKPIIFAINAPTTPVEESNCGIIIHPENKQEMVDAVHTLMGMKQDERLAMGQRGKSEILLKYTYRELANSFVNAWENS